MTIITRSANDKLYGIFKTFWSEENTFIQCKQFAGYHGALSYLLHLMNDYDGWIVNADEDFFCTNEVLINRVIDHMKLNDFDFAGVPDGGIISHRNNSQTNVNPFFNIFNVGKIKTKISEFDNSKSLEYMREVAKDGRYHNMNEPFACFLYWLHLNFKGAHFTDIETTDGVNTIIKINGKPLGIHSWYSRAYGVDVAQTERIDCCIEWAVKNKV